MVLSVSACRSLYPEPHKTIHEMAYPIDTHLDSLYLARVSGYDFWKGDWKATRTSPAIALIKAITPKGINKPLCDHVSGPDFIAGGYGGACFSAHALWENLFSDPFFDPWKNWLDHAAYVRQIVETSSGRMRLTATPAAVRQAKAEGLRSAILSVEGAHVLGATGKATQDLRLKRLTDIAKDGAAYLTLNHFCTTDISEAGYAPTNPWRKIAGGGLSAYGRHFVETAMEAGLLIDVSHTSSQGILDTAAIALKRGVPVFASHAASRSITAGTQTSASRHLDRGLNDAAIRAIVETGGTISVILSPYFLKHATLANGKPDRDADLVFVIRYYEKLAELIDGMGITDDPWKHLTFGSDFDGGISSIPTGMTSGADLPKLTEAMLDAGWPSERIIDVYSENFLRVWQAAQAKTGDPSAQNTASMTAPAAIMPMASQ
ncbi:membrane dipeptidase [Allorhizobium sp. BGMRC 0089]|uniref:membrane dipeptidase n=1 Tax=Allorhizobium sonneratiae TaxID=2934936 RepID=UPI0020338929|nr:membrane dipeptidase [Allorhizobium sonneratiae]MCM2293703.1 membrane dipeptidase [Allorhizobium sonneratiae]